MRIGGRQFREGHAVFVPEQTISPPPNLQCPARLLLLQPVALGAEVIDPVSVEQRLR
jgi:hypothetical protein